MGVKDIYINLGIEPDYKKEIEKTNKRLYQAVCWVDSELTKRGQGEVKSRIFELIGDIPRRHLENFIEYQYPEESEKALMENLYFISFVLNALEKKCSYKEIVYTFTDKVEEILESFPLLDLGYRFKEGQIIKSGADGLDDILIIENLKWLENYPNTREFFSKSLENYFRKNYPDSITNAYSSLEGIVKTILNTDGRLDNEKTRKELLKKLNLGSDWGQILFHFSKIAHEFSSRHGKKDTNNLNNKSREILGEDLVEFYIYITGTFIRLISRRIK
jgi:hypothetical protein